MKVIDEAVREYLSSMKIPRRVRELIKKARFDLYYGPYPAGLDERGSDDVVYPGFSSAVTEIRNGMDGIGDIYVDLDSGCWQTSEPQTEEDDDGNLISPGEYRLVDGGYIKRQLLGKELAPYV